MLCQHIASGILSGLRSLCAAVYNCAVNALCASCAIHSQPIRLMFTTCSIPVIYGVICFSSFV